MKKRQKAVFVIRACIFKAIVLCMAFVIGAFCAAFLIGLFLVLPIELLGYRLIRFESDWWIWVCITAGGYYMGWVAHAKHYFEAPFDRVNLDDAWYLITKRW